MSEKFKRTNAALRTLSFFRAVAEDNIVKMSNEEIAETLGYKVRSVQTHLNYLKAKGLVTRTRVGAQAWEIILFKRN